MQKILAAQGAQIWLTKVEYYPSAKAAYAPLRRRTTCLVPHQNGADSYTIEGLRSGLPNGPLAPRTHSPHFPLPCHCNSKTLERVVAR
eukprot:1035875-Pleurochrysis_carterae.AAC.1